MADRSKTSNSTLIQTATPGTALVTNVNHLTLEDAFGLSSCCSTWCETFKINMITEELTFYNDSYTEEERRCLLDHLKRYNMFGGCK